MQNRTKSSTRSSDIRRRMGFPLHDGTLDLGHLARPEEDLLAFLHAVRCLVANPDAIALGPEASASSAGS